MTRSGEDRDQPLLRPSNKSRAELTQLAAAAVTRHGGPHVARVFFKYDCPGCAKRVTIPEPGVLAARAQCACGTWAAITEGGMLVETRLSTDVGWDEPKLWMRKRYVIVPEQVMALAWER